jgi:acyl-CoA thioesterase FadM
MGGWLETYRGWVTPWECDIIEHLTIAYYFARFADSHLALMEAIGVGPSYMSEAGRGCVAVDCYARFTRELRNGDVLHLDAAILGVEDKILHSGHKVFDSASGEVAATIEQKLIHLDLERRRAAAIPPERRRAMRDAVVEWDGPRREKRHMPEGTEGFIDGVRDTVKPWEIDLMGHLGIQFYIHRFSASAAHAMAAFGMTPDYVRDQRRGMSTFEIDIRFRRELHAGDLVAVRTALVHVGSSSFRLLHKMFNLRSGELAAVMSQFAVHLDMDARRPTPLPDELRARAEAMLVS